MFAVHADNIADYLREIGRVGRNEPVAAAELAGGVSNIVLLITLPERNERFVVKQARGQLRVKDDWKCPVERIWREVEMLQQCSQLLAAPEQATAGEYQLGVPQLLWQQRDNFLYAMSAALPEHRPWKDSLLAAFDSEHEKRALACGQLLATIHGGSWNQPQLAPALLDQTYFEQLRVDPYYHQIARAHPDRAAAVQELIDSLASHRLALVHGDFSPKNLLVWPGHLLLIDFEVGHYGDPAFDLGFFLAHLVLKTLRAESPQSYVAVIFSFWSSYTTSLANVATPAQLQALEQRTLANLAGCLLARVDGKSPVDYLSVSQQALVRALARRWLEHLPANLAQALGPELIRWRAEPRLANGGR